MRTISIGLFVLALIFGGQLHAQKPAKADSLKTQRVLQTVIVDGDTIPMVTLDEATILSRRARSKRYQRKWSKMHANVVKTYPYARVAADLINAYNEELQYLETDAEREAYMDKCEEDLKAEFEGDLRKMTTSQGRVLIKLIDRETGHTSYDLIRDLKSGFTAFMWQGVARMFGTNLKDQFDPEENEYDAMIEEIVQLIERGEIYVKKREVKTTAAAQALEDKSKRLERKIEREKRKKSKKK